MNKHFNVYLVVIYARRSLYEKIVGRFLNRQIQFCGYLQDKLRKAQVHRLSQGMLVMVEDEKGGLHNWNKLARARFIGVKISREPMSYFEAL